MSSTAYAADEKQALSREALKFTIEEQPIGDALNEFARQSGLQIFLLASDDAKRLNGSSVVGRFEPPIALTMLLANTGLSYRYIDTHSIAIIDPASSRKSDPPPVDELDATTADTVVYDHSVAAAQLEEVVVTAERRVSDLQKTAASVSVRNGQRLREEGRFSLRQILEDVPGIDYVDRTSQTAGGSDQAGNHITIRGVPSNTSLAAVPSVATTVAYTDGIYEGIGGSYDIERVEVLRGPQGTLYGRSATAGLVAIYTRNPDLNKFGADVAAELGSYSLQHYNAAVNAPLGSALAVRLAGNHYQRTGYYNGQGGANETSEGRLKLLYEPSDNFSLLFGAALQNNGIHTGGADPVMTAPDVFRYDPAAVFSGKHRFRQYWANVDWNFGAATLTYLPSLRTWQQEGVSYLGTRFGSQGGVFVQPARTPFDQFVTHELRLASRPDSKLVWLLGALHYDNRVRGTNRVEWQSSGATVYDAATTKRTKDVGIFGELTYSIADTLRLTAGGRYDYNNVETGQVYTANTNFMCNTPLPQQACSDPSAVDVADSPDAGEPESNVTAVLSGAAGTRRFYNTTYKLRLERDLTPTNLLYAMASSGFLPGDVQIQGNPPRAYEFDVQTLKAYEIGSKNRLLDKHLQINASAYYYRYGGFQQMAEDPDSPTNYVIVLPASMRGGEFELLYQLSEKDRIGLSYAYTDSRYVDKPAQFSAQKPQEHVAGITPHTLNATYSHTFPLRHGALMAHVDGRLLSSHRVTNPSSEVIAAGYGDYARVGNEVVWNANGTWVFGGGRYSVTAYVRNVGDNRYTTTATFLSVSNGYVASGIQSEPRTYGMMMTAHF